MARRSSAGAFLVDAYTYGDQLDKVFGLIGDMRIVGRALLPVEFMNA